MKVNKKGEIKTIPVVDNETKELLMNIVRERAKVILQRKILDSIGITDDYLYQKIKEGLDAKWVCFEVRKKYLDMAEKIGYRVSEELKKEILESKKSLFNGLERFFDHITPDNIKFVGDRKLWIKTKKLNRNPDFIVENTNLLIELYGDYWHRGENPQDKIQEYNDVGYKCLVLWESDVYEDTEKVLEKVDRFIGSV